MATKTYALVEIIDNSVVNVTTSTSLKNLTKTAVGIAGGNGYKQSGDGSLVWVAAAGDCQVTILETASL